MQPVFSSHDVRAADAAAVEAGTSIDTLMYRAGWATATAAARILGGAYGARVLVVCGAGNNAGDGLVAARLLRQWGAHVEVLLALGDDFATEASRNARASWTQPVLGSDDVFEALDRCDLVIDALLGVGLTRDTENELSKVIIAINGSETAVLSIDVPSGIEADTGKQRGEAIHAVHTVTFGALKPGLRFPPGVDFAGRIQIVDIGLPEVSSQVWALEANDVADLWPVRVSGDHKHSAGNLLLIAGSEAMPGAAILSAKAAVAAGAGLVHVAIPRASVSALVAACPDAIPVPYDAPWLDAVHARELLAAGLRIDALAIGPGLGREVGTLAAVRTLLEHLETPAIVDADALYPIAVVSRNAPTVVTPHAGEWSVITELESKQVARDRLSAAQILIETLEPRIPGIIGVLKGSGTVISSMTDTYLDLEGGPELSQGGTGDVLTGILGALAAGLSKAGTQLDSANVAAGVWVHSRAGKLAAASVGGTQPAGASRVIEQIPAAIASALSVSS
jgi:ADP-dependent NAD(P)H-hydrate dehydratase / NAD(P)H-hydrate epimerase